VKSRITVLSHPNAAGMFVEGEGDVGFESQVGAFDDDFWDEFVAHRVLRWGLYPIKLLFALLPLMVPIFVFHSRFNFTFKENIMHHTIGTGGGCCSCGCGCLTLLFVLPCLLLVAVLLGAL
jgi:hypothetical protein